MIPPEQIRRQVRAHYAARSGGGGCCGEGPLASGCCGAPEVSAGGEVLEHFSGPSLGCGSPLEYAGVRSGEVVVDLGSGAGREVLLAARQAAPGGYAVGVDMTPEMVWKARENAERTGIANAEFRLGEIEHLPLADRSADVVISNCVINLVPDKRAAFREAFRVLRPGGRLVVSDIVTRGPIPETVRRSMEAWAACVGGALDLDDYLAAIRAAGFVDVEPVSTGTGTVFSVTVRARKPAAEAAG